MSRELKEIEIYHEDYGDDWIEEGIVCWVIPSDEIPDEGDEGFDEDLEDQELIDIPNLGFLFVYSYDGQITHFFPEGISLETYFKNIDNPEYTPIKERFDYHGDGLDIEDQPAHVIIKEVLKKRGYI